MAQSPYIYNDTLEANIFLGKGPRREEDLKEAYDLLTLFGLDFLAPTREELFNLKVGSMGRGSVVVRPKGFAS